MKNNIDPAFGDVATLRTNLVSWARRYVDRNGAEDLAHDTLLRMFIYRDSFTPGTNPEAWATTIMQSVVSNAHRRARNAPVKENSLAQPSRRYASNQVALADEPGGGHNHHIDGRVVNQYSTAGCTTITPEREAIANDELRRCKKQRHWPILLATGMGYKDHEIGAAMSLPRCTIRTHLFRARNALAMA